MILASNTERFGLLKKDPIADGNDTFNIQTMLNDNWDKLDAAAKKSELDAHTGDTTVHITATDRDNWNAKETPADAQEKADQAEQNAKAYTDTAPEAMQRNLGNFNVSKSEKDSNGIFTTVEYKRPDGTLYARSVLSNADTNGNYQTRTITYYATDGTTVVRTDTYTLAYDEDGDLTSEVKA